MIYVLFAGDFARVLDASTEAAAQTEGAALAAQLPDEAALAELPACRRIVIDRALVAAARREAERAARHAAIERARIEEREDQRLAAEAARAQAAIDARAAGRR